MAAKAEAATNAKDADKTAQKIANLKKGLENKELDEGTETEIKDKIATNEKKLEGLKKSIEKDKEIAQEAENEKLENEAKVKDIKKSIADLEAKASAEQAEVDDATKQVAAIVDGPKAEGTKDAKADAEK